MRRPSSRVASGATRFSLVTRPELSERCRWGEKAAGWQIFRAGCVSLTGTADSASARIAGSPLHRVEIRFWKNRRELWVDCSCGRGVSEFCEHVWATLLKASDRGHLASVQPVERGLLGIVQGANLSERLVPDLTPGPVEAPTQRDGSAEFDVTNLDLDRLLYSGLRPGPQPAPRPDSPPDPWQRVDKILAKRVRGVGDDYQASSTESLLHLVLDLGKAATGHLPGRVGYLSGNRLSVGELSFFRMMRFSNTLDVELCAIALRSAADNDPYFAPRYRSEEALGRPTAIFSHGLSTSSPIHLQLEQHASLLHRLAQERRLHSLQPDGTVKPLAFSPDPWGLRVQITPSCAPELEASNPASPAPVLPSYALTGVLERGQFSLATSDPAVRPGQGAVLHQDELAPVKTGDTEWIQALTLEGAEPIQIPPSALESFLEQFMAQEDPPQLELPASLSLVEEAATPEPLVNIGAPDGGRLGLPVDIQLSYSGREIPLGARGTRVVDLVKRRIYVRDIRFEEQVTETLLALNIHPPTSLDENFPEKPLWRLVSRRVPEVVTALVEKGWQVFAERQRYQRIRSFDFEISSGIQWLELDGTVRLDSGELPVGQVIRALRRKQRKDRFIDLGDGSLGLLPEKWISTWESLAHAAAPQSPGDGPVRLPRAHVGTLLALAESADHTRMDDGFKRLQEGLQELKLPTAAKPPKAFHGTLRDYQAKGLGWLRFLEKLGFGGCLADDMGLGKTVQILALLAGRAKRHGPSLVVAPRSVLDNWREETERFVPSLPVQIHHGTSRAVTTAELEQPHLVLTSHALLIRDIELLSQVDFDYVILDEAQNIKNGGTATARAARALKSRNRVALTGTPVENHLGELWSILEFTNPGLGSRLPGGGSARSSSQKSAPASGASSEEEANDSGASSNAPVGLDEALLAQVRAVVKPFLLRRTKKEVAPELPPRIEQTLTVRLKPWEMQPYLELHSHYREKVSDALLRLGIQRSTPHVLEALLRLRQAACHPALIDQSLSHSVSSKTAILLERLEEIREEGNQALVFSQFTTHLDLVQIQLEAAGFRFERLDGATQKRAERVKRFQTDSDITVFLISLKAGGTGLNLTAADYVFLLDPWWNPAAEAQAIDRAHRIGRDRPVVAYRLIAKGTIEEKVLELQARKRALANQVLSDDDTAFVGRLTRQDLLQLLEASGTALTNPTQQAKRLPPGRSDG